MTTVTFTKSIEPDSTLVDVAYYNENTRELVMDLNDELYRYEGVPVSVWNGLMSADSAGRFYSTHIKRQYGPSTHLGRSWSVDYQEATPKAALASVGTANDWSFSADAITNGSIVTTGATETFNLTATVTPAERQHAVSFTVGDDTSVKVHTLSAVSVDQAVEVVESLGTMLDLDFHVKEVTVYFE